MEAPGIEADLRQIESTEEHRSGTISTDGDPANVSDRASKCAIVRGVVTESSEAYELSNVVETALARALRFGGGGEAVGRRDADCRGAGGEAIGHAASGASREPGEIGCLSAYDLNMRERIAGRMMMKGAPSGSGAGMMNAHFSSFFVSVRSPLESVE